MLYRWMLAAALVAFQAACQPAAKPQTPPLREQVFAEQKTFKPLWAYHYAGRLPCSDCDYVQADLVLNANAEYLLVAQAVLDGVAGQKVMRMGSYHIRPDGLVMLDERGKYWVLAAENGQLRLGGLQAAVSVFRDGDLCNIP